MVANRCHDQPLGRPPRDGAVFSPAVKARLIAHHPTLMIIDALGSSESSGTGIVITTAAGSSGGGKFQPLPGRETKLFDENLQEIPRGTEGVGIVARTGPLPLGYLGEDEKNRQTFPEIGGQRWLMTGDRARWASDGTLEFIGRDNMCINTGGEKVFPEEVEETLKTHAAIDDALVFGLPDEKWGQCVTAVVEAHAPVDVEELRAHVRQHLAGYKTPKTVHIVKKVPRAPNGKADYAAAKAMVTG